MALSVALSSTESIISQKRKPNWVKDFPVIGQGTLIFSIERNTSFFIVIRPKLEPGEPGADDWISLAVTKDSALFSMSNKGKVQILKTVTGKVKHQSVGYETGCKISYWFSYNRNLLTLKYGKGYIMEETTLMTYNFLEGVLPEKEDTIRTELKYLFSPRIRRRIEQYDEMPIKMMIQMYTDAIKRSGSGGAPISVKRPAVKSSEAGLEAKAEGLAKSIIDIEEMVAFDKNPFVCNWSPFVLDSSKVDLFKLDSNTYTFSASLPSACQELYTNVTAPNVDLDWPSVDKYKLSDAMRHSLNDKKGILHKKLQSKKEFGSFEKTYLRVTLGKNRGSSPGIPYVLEIWPSKHGSPIHNHGNAYAVIKVVHGGLTIKVFNKQADKQDAKHLQKFSVKNGDCTWISPNWFQTHKLYNDTSDFCATIQCYQYAENDLFQWPYFDYVSNTDLIDEFLPLGDYTFHEIRDLVMQEYTEYMEKSGGT